HSGRTVLFVSHNMAAVEGLCTICLLLKEGVSMRVGHPAEVIKTYLSSHSVPSRACLHFPRTGHNSPDASCPQLITRVEVVSHDFGTGGPVPINSGLTVKVDFDSPHRPFRPVLGVVVKTIDGVALLGVDNRFIGGYSFPPMINGRISCILDRVPLAPGRYFLDIYLGDEFRSLQCLRDTIMFEVVPADIYGTGKLPPRSAGPIVWSAQWAIQ
ncbi:MAG: Wzt carbohydrate-binding domain-containing protein, partial [Thermogutta sp.]